MTFVSRSVRSCVEVTIDELGGVHLRLPLAIGISNKLPPLSLSRVRRRVLRSGGLAIGDRTTIGGRLWIGGGSSPVRAVTTGVDCFINDGCRLDTTASITIGDRVHIGHDVRIIGRALISTRMLPSWDVPTPWLEIGSEVARETLDALMITLGPELGTYVTATELPPTPTDTARAALRAAADVTDLATAEIPAVQSVRVTLTATELQAVFPDETTSRDESLEIDFDIDDERRIVRIAVRQRGVAPRVDGEEGPGWQVRYSGFGAATTATLPPSSEVTTAGNVFTPAEPATFVYDDCEFGA